jgi:hypothetical protein
MTYIKLPVVLAARIKDGTTPVVSRVFNGYSLGNVNYEYQTTLRVEFTPNSSDPLGSNRFDANDVLVGMWFATPMYPQTVMVYYSI